MCIFVKVLKFIKVKVKIFFFVSHSWFFHKATVLTKEFFSVRKLKKNSFLCRSLHFHKTPVV